MDDHSDHSHHSVGGADDAAVSRRRAVRLSEILPDARFIGCRDLLGRGVSDDAERCHPGEIFVARLTAGGDGHDQVAEAIARGASGVVAERIVPTFGTPLCLVRHACDAFARIAHALEGDPARRLGLTAVTGTSGKTTTAWLTAAVLAEAGIPVGVLSDLGCLDGEGLSPMPRGDDGRRLDDPRTLARLLRRLVETGCTHAIVEVSSAMLAAAAMAGVACETVVVTNLGTAHLDLHGTRSAYRRIKRRILECLTPDGCLVVNTDDRRLARMADRHEGRGLSASLTGEGDVTASTVERGLRGRTFVVEHAGCLVPVSVATPVASFARNAVLAASVGVRYGLPLESVVRGIESAGSVSGRVEPIACGQEFAAYLDRPTCMHQASSTLASLRRLTTGRLVVLLGGSVAHDLDRDAGSGGTADDTLARWCDEIVLVDSRRRSRGRTRAGTRSRPRGAGEGNGLFVRVGRLLDGLRADDCLLVLDDPPPLATDPTDPSGEPMSLASVVAAWMRSTAASVELPGARRAA